MSKFQIEEHGDIYKLSHPEITPIIVCPECGEEAKLVDTKDMHSDDKWYGYTYFEKEVYRCMNCNCRFSKEKEGSYGIRLDGENIGMIIMMSSGFFTVIDGIIAAALNSGVFAILAVISFILFFIGGHMYTNS